MAEWYIDSYFFHLYIKFILLILYVGFNRFFLLYLKTLAASNTDIRIKLIKATNRNRLEKKIFYHKYYLYVREKFYDSYEY